MELRSRAAGAMRGAVAAGSPGCLLLVACEAHNAAFVDAPVWAWGLMVALPGLLGAALGSRWPTTGARRWMSWALAQAALVFGLSVDDGLAPVEEIELVVLGIDGATWEQVDPLPLHELHRLRREGASGQLTVPPPLFSPLLWTAMAAGREDHGVHGFRNHSNDVQVPRFFDIAELSGRRIGLYKWLVSWPPRELRHGGFIVPGWLAPTPETQPKALSVVKEVELSRRLRRQSVAATRSAPALALAGLGQGWRFSTLRDATLWSLRERLLRPTELDRVLALNLLRGRMDRDTFVFAVQRHRPALATFTWYATDALGHRFWRFHEPEAFSDVPAAEVARYGGAIEAAYRGADDVLGEIRDLLPADARLVVVSDHGFTAGHEARFIVRTERLHRALEDRVGAVDVARVGARATITPLANQTQQQLLAAVEALSRSDGAPLYRWERMEDDRVGLGLASEETLDAALETATVQGEPLSAWIEEAEAFSGDHTERALFAALGPGVTPGTPVDLQLLDVAPVLLAALQLAPDVGMTGRVPPGIWPAVEGATDWSEAREALVFPGATEERGVNEEALEALGYIDGDR